MSEPSIEELQNQIAELTKAKEEQSQEIEKLKQTSTENEENLKKARELNASLLLRVTAESPESGEVETPEDSVESLCEEIVTKVNEAYIRRTTHAD